MATRSTGTGIFINYRREDQPFVAKTLYEMLRNRFGKQQVFWDVDRIPLGHDFIELIEASVAQCRVMLVVIGDKWLTCVEPSGRRRLDNPNDFVRLEIETALARMDVLVVPIVVGLARYPGATEPPESMGVLARKQGMTMSFDSFNDDYQRLLRELENVVDF